MGKGIRDKGQGTRESAVRDAILIAGIVLVLCLNAGWALYAQQPPQPPEGFVPAANLPGQEQLPAAPLVITAYSVVWLLVFGYLWSIWRRIARAERDLADVSRRISVDSRR
jgi:CcmD family protein